MLEYIPLLELPNAALLIRNPLLEVIFVNAGPTSVLDLLWLPVC